MNELEWIGLENTVAKGITSYPYTKNLDDLFLLEHLFIGSVEFILNRQDCATYFLDSIINGDITFYDNALVMKTFIDLHGVIRPTNSSLHCLKDKFQLSLDYIEANILKVLNIEDETLEDCIESFNYYASYGPYPLVFNAISIARKIALKSYTQKMVTHLSKWTDINDLFGDSYIKLSKIKNNDIIEWFGAIKLDHSDVIIANFTKSTNDDWIFRFSNLGPYPHNYFYKLAAYQAVIDFFTYAFSCEVELISFLDK
jgi:hypothetical protein